MSDKENQKMGNTHLRILLGCFVCTVLLLFRHGYTFGSGDQSEMLPYSKYLTDNTLYASDFYIQSISSVVPNERYIFSWFLSLFGDNMDWAAFGLHFVATMLLILAIYRIAAIEFRTEWGRWLATLAATMLFYGVNLGGNELYYNTFIPSYVAQVIGLWVLFYAMRGSIIPVFALLVLTTYVHPLIGIQLWLLVNLAFLVIQFFNKTKDPLIALLIVNGLYFVTAGLFVFEIKSGYDASDVTTQQFFDIIAFRAPHHYFPHTYPLSSWLILGLPFLLSWVLASGFIRFLFSWIVVGSFVYIIGIYVFQNTTPLSMQWFSTTVWVKTFSIIITLNFIEALLDRAEFHKKLLASKHSFLYYLTAASLVAAVFMTPQYRLLTQKSYDFPFFNTDNAEVQISKLAKQHTPKDALFLIPSDLSEFRFWSERASFIDYKATNHRQAAFAEWYKRIQEVYKISLSDRLKGANLTVLANYNFQHLTAADFIKLRENQHITHVLTYKNVPFLSVSKKGENDFQRVVENDKYVIYKIP
jgi:hypothetical protein